MGNNYVAFIDDTINDYVEYLIMMDPDLYATDGVNNRIVQRYFKDVYNTEVHDDIASTVHPLTRAKSKFLQANPDMDRGIKEADMHTPKSSK
ncbi:hypothetical protein [Sulfurovum sp. AR]|uniref:hypothetical protein n=1 Tax=Sulfurovum sp. AR TaxID=1165841 RepID=UPI00025C47CC|nr:hypothetical protein [Sulfurovum sp. AR]EIF50714.1 hypothetical protein SULAR_05078 [Sulfurovum sp. AR]